MATVSRVVNGNKNVKENTRKKVLEVIDRLDYRPNAVARGLASKKTTTVGVVIPNITNGYFSTLAKGIDDIAEMYKYNIVLANSDEDDEKEVSVVNTLFSKQVDGIIFMGYHLTEKIRSEFSRSRTPVVLAGTVDVEHQLPSVNIDEWSTHKSNLFVFFEKIAHSINRCLFVVDIHTWKLVFYIHSTSKNNRCP